MTTTHKFVACSAISARASSSFRRARAQARCTVRLPRKSSVRCGDCRAPRVSTSSCGCSSIAMARSRSRSSSSRSNVDEQTLREAPARLSGSGRIECTEKAGESAHCARNLLIPLGSPVGWEAAVFDHFKAMVNTITGKLREDRAAPTLLDTVGGSTYTLDIWPGHPLANEVCGTLRRLRSMLVELRERVESVNAEAEVPSVGMQPRLRPACPAR